MNDGALWLSLLRNGLNKNLKQFGPVAWGLNVLVFSFEDL